MDQASMAILCAADLSKVPFSLWIRNIWSARNVWKACTFRKWSSCADACPTASLARNVVIMLLSIPPWFCCTGASPGAGGKNSRLGSAGISEPRPFVIANKFACCPWCPFNSVALPFVYQRFPPGWQTLLLKGEGNVFEIPKDSRGLTPRKFPATLGRQFGPERFAKVP
jgi:hypothetical protein